LGGAKPCGFLYSAAQTPHTAETPSVQACFVILAVVITPRNKSQAFDIFVVTK
jgi:hypothetical protein